MGLFTLIACSEDTYQEADKMNEEPDSQYQTNSFNPNDPGYYVPGAGFPPNQAGGDYASPWDIWYRGTPEVIPSYTFANLEGEGVSPFVIEITPYLGLAYYDDVNDGLFHDPAQGYSLIHDMTTGNFPSLYANNNEIGNLIKAKTIVLDGTSVQNNEFSIGSDQDHCPVDLANITTGWNPMGRFLDIDSSATSDEKKLIAKYGKAFFFGITIYERSNPSNVFVNEIFQVQCNTLGVVSDWLDTGVQANPFGTVHKLHYYKDLVKGPGTYYYHNIPAGQGICDSREVVFRNEFSNKKMFSYLGDNYQFDLYIAQGVYLWMTSGIYLGIDKL
mgnify:CR=1 FL=1